MKKTQITVESANHKYLAVIDSGNVVISCVASSYGEGWEEKTKPRKYVFPHSEILSHPPQRMFSVKETSINKTWAMATERINAEPFEKIKQKLEQWIKEKESA